MDQHRLGDDVVDRVARVKRCVRVLEDNLHLRPEVSHPLGRGVHHVLSAEGDSSRGWLDQAKDGPTKGGLTAAGFPNDAQCLPTGDREADAIDRMYDTDVASKEPGPNREVCNQVVDPQNLVARAYLCPVAVDAGAGVSRAVRPGVAVVCLGHCAACPVTSSTGGRVEVLWQRDQWSSPTSSRVAGFSAQTSVRWTQRV